MGLKQKGALHITYLKQKTVIIEAVIFLCYHASSTMSLLKNGSSVLRNISSQEDNEWSTGIFVAINVDI